MKKLPAVKKEDMHIGCLTCSTVGQVADLGMIVCVGFGSAQVTKNGAIFYDGQRHFLDGGEPKTLGEIEGEAQLCPDDDWRVTMYGPLHGETYQRQKITADLKFGPLPDNYLSTCKQYAWVIVDSNQGFA